MEKTKKGDGKRVKETILLALSNYIKFEGNLY